jgi:hypothetical protein
MIVLVVVLKLVEVIEELLLVEVEVVVVVGTMASSQPPRAIVAISATKTGQKNFFSITVIILS